MGHAAAAAVPEVLQGEGVGEEGDLSGDQRQGAGGHLVLPAGGQEGWKASGCGQRGQSSVEMGQGQLGGHAWVAPVAQCQGYYGWVGHGVPGQDQEDHEGLA